MSAGTREGRGSPWLLRLLLLVLFAAIAIGVAIWTPWPLVGPAITAADPFWLLLAISANAAIFPVWAAQWNLLCGGLGEKRRHSEMLRIVSLSALAANLLSAAAGIASSIALLLSHGRLTPSAAAALLALDQLLVGTSKVIILLVAVQLLPLPEQFGQAAAFLSLLVAAGALFLVAVVKNAEWLKTRAALSSSALNSAVAFLVTVAQAFQVMRRPLIIGAAFALMLLKKTFEVGAVLAVQLACGIEPSPAGALLVVAAVGLVSAVPVLPGGLGVYSAAVFSVYGLMGVDTGPAVAASVLQHFVKLLPALLFGLGATLLFRSTARAADKFVRHG